MSRRALTMTAPLLDQVRRGGKIQTLRRWSPQMARWEAGDRLLLHCYGHVPGATVVVESVDQVALDDLTWEDALYDGMDSLESLLVALDRLGVSGPLARIRFSDPRHVPNEQCRGLELGSGL